MVISVSLYGGLGLILRITRNRFFLLVLYKVGVHGELFYIIYFIILIVIFPYSCRAPSGQLDNDEDVYERRSRAHTDFLCTMCEMSVLYDNYGIIGDIIVRTQ